MITDLVQIRQLGEKKRDENFRFRRYLKTHDFADRRLRKIAENIEEQIDCTLCANCCRVATVKPLDRDIDKMSRYLRLSRDVFLREYTMPSEDEGRILKRTESGCVFLQGNECTIYQARPATCENFPHLVRGAGSIASRMWQFVDRATYCPIVYNWMETVKEKVRFR